MTELQKASLRMFGPEGLGVTNVKFTLGSNRDVSAEDIARELNKALDRLEEGNLEEIPNAMFSRDQVKQASIELKA